MSQDINSQQPDQVRRAFASKFEHKLWGWILLAFGVFQMLSNGISGGVASKVIAVVSILAGVYLLRGRGVSPRQAAKNERKAALAASSVESALVTLQNAKGGAVLVAYRNLDSTIKKFYKADATSKWNEALASIEFDVTKVQSEPIGSIRAFGGSQVEVFQDWIIFGQNAYDIEQTTRGEVHLDGSFVSNAKGQREDQRRAELQFVSANWSMRASIFPDDVNLARQLVSQVSVIVDGLKPAAATAADIAAMVQAILTNTGQPPAERIEQLSALRYQRLLSDEEFEAAKTKVLGI